MSRLLYSLGVGATTFIISCGNVMNLDIVSNKINHEYEYNGNNWNQVCAKSDATGLFLFGFCMAKGITYGLLWPVFWPYAIMQESNKNSNGNEFLPGRILYRHLVPGYRVFGMSKYYDDNDEKY